MKKNKTKKFDFSNLSGEKFTPGVLIFKSVKGVQTAFTVPYESLPVRKNPGDENGPQVYEYKGKPKSLAQVLLK